MEPTHPGLPQWSDRSKRAVDNRFSAALKLGYYSRDIDLEFLDHSLAVLGDGVQQNVFFALQQAIERLDTSDDERELQRALLPEYDLPDKWEEETRNVKALRSYADQAIAPANPIRSLYKLGAALGDYLLYQQSPGRSPDTLQVWDAVSSLPAWCLESARSLRELAKYAAERPNLERVLEDVVQGTELRPDEMISNLPVNSRTPPAVLRFVWEASHDLADIPDSAAAPDVDTGWDAATEARNKWIYEKCKEVMPYSQIICRLGNEAGGKGWDSIGTTNGIKRARDEYIKRHGLKPLPNRHPGRRTGN
jgi:hypothetical protein